MKETPRNLPDEYANKEWRIEFEDGTVRETQIGAIAWVAEDDPEATVTEL